MMGGKITKKRVREKKNEKEIALFCVGTEIRKGKGNLSFFFFLSKGREKIEMWCYHILRPRKRVC